MGSLNGLIQHLLDEIALCGKDGAGVSEVANYVRDFYGKTQGKSKEGAEELQHQLIDSTFLARIWIWLDRDADVQITRGCGAGLPLDALIAGTCSCTESGEVSRQSAVVPNAFDRELRRCLRARTSEERIWLAAAGHRPDSSKVPPLDFACLSVIASRREEGIIQPHLVRLTGQDKRSVPSRTQRLCDRGYIAKITVTAWNTKTSLLFLKRFEKSKEELPKSYFTTRKNRRRDAGRVGRPESNAAPPAHGDDGVGSDRALGMEDFARRLVHMLAKDRALPLDTVKSKFTRADLSFSLETFVKVMSVLERMGSAQRIRPYSSIAAPELSFVRCVRLSHDMSDQDWDDFAVLTKTLPDRTPESFGPIAECAVDREEHYRLDPGVVLGKPDDENLPVEATRVTPSPPRWDPALQLANLLYRTVDKASTTGVSIAEAQRQTVGSFFRRPFENTLTRILRHPDADEPWSANTLKVVRDAAQAGRTAFFVHYSLPRFAEKVAHGEASWEAIGPPKAFEENGLLDDHGFPPLHADDFRDDTHGDVRNDQAKRPLTQAPLRRKPYNPQPKIPGVRSKKVEARVRSIPLLSYEEQVNAIDRPSTGVFVGRLVHLWLQEQRGRPRRSRIVIFKSSRLRDLGTPPPPHEAFCPRTVPDQVDQAPASQPSQPQPPATSLPQSPNVSLAEKTAAKRTCDAGRLPLEDRPRKRVRFNGSSSTVHSQRVQNENVASLRSQTQNGHRSDATTSSPPTMDDEGLQPSAGSTSAENATRNRNPHDTENHGPLLDPPPYIRELSTAPSTGDTNLSEAFVNRLISGPSASTPNGGSQTVSNAPPVYFMVESSPQTRKTPSAEPEMIVNGKSPVRDKAASARRMMPFGGSIAALRKRIVLDIVEASGGVYPGDRELWFPFASIWMQKQPYASRPDQKTVKLTRKALVDSGKLRHIMFNFQGVQNTVTTRSIVTLPHVEPSDPRVVEMRRQIIAHDPVPYIPDGVEVLPELRPTTVAERSERISTNMRAERAKRGDKVYSGPKRSPDPEQARVRACGEPCPHVATGAGTEESPEIDFMPPLGHHNVAEHDFEPRLEPCINNDCGPRFLDPLSHEHVSHSGPKFILTSTCLIPLIPKTRDPKVKRVDPVKQARVVEKRIRSITGIGHGHLRRSGEMTAKRVRRPAAGANYRNGVPAPVVPPPIVQAPRLHPRWRFVTPVILPRPFFDSVRPVAATSTVQELPPAPASSKERQPAPAVSKKRKTAPTSAGARKKARVSSEAQQPARSPPKKQRGDRTPVERRGASRKSATKQTSLNPPLPSLAETGDGPPALDPGERPGDPDPANEPPKAREKVKSGKKKKKALVYQTKTSRLASLIRKPWSSAEWTDRPQRREPVRRVRIRGPLTEQLLGPDGDFRICIAVIIVRTLTGGIERSIDWDTVLKILTSLPNTLTLRRRWARIRDRSRQLSEQLTHDFQEAFLREYSAGKMPTLRFDKLEEFDWDGLYTWALDTLRVPQSTQANLPATRSELEEKYKVRESHNRGQRDIFFECKNHASIPRRHALFHKQPAMVVLPLRPTQTLEGFQAELAKNWIRAIAATPEGSYEPKVGQAKLTPLSGVNMDGIIQSFVRDRVLAVKRGDRTRLGREYSISEMFLARLMFNVELGSFSDALKQKSTLDKIDTGTRVPFDEVATDGNMLAILNLVAERRLKLYRRNIPAKEFGLNEDGDYRTRSLDKGLLNFDVDIGQSESYIGSNPLSPLPRLPQPETSTKVPAGRFPLWTDINGGELPLLWVFLLAAVMNICLARPGTTADIMVDWLGSGVEMLDIRGIMTWLVEARAASWIGKRKDAIRLEEWWWMVFEEASGQSLTSY